MSRTPKSKSAAQHLRPADLRGLAQLATQATLGVTGITEGVHQSVLGTLGLGGGPGSGKARGLTGLIYKTVRGVTHLVGAGLDIVLSRLQPLLETVEHSQPGSPQREAVLAALNGVMGDHLVAGHSPFATSMTFRMGGEVLHWPALQKLPQASDKLLLLIHGLCMNDLQWRTNKAGQTPDHGAALAAALGYTPVYLRYNTGLHTSQNGRELAAQLEQLVAQWPRPVQELAVVAHSMGGLVIRSACHYAQSAGMRWPERLGHIIFLGTPHHGAPLERAGNWLDVILGSTPYTAPFAKLGQLRSAGITDLRYGHIVDEDWLGHDRFRRKPDSRQPLPLPPGVACYTIAATTAAKRSKLADRVVGDGLVPLPSALGQHDDPARCLKFAKSAQWIAYRTGHMALLGSPEVTEQMIRWLRPV